MNAILPTDQIQSLARPGDTKPSKGNWSPTLLAAGLIAICVYWILIPNSPQLNTAIIGDESTDAIRGLWGFDHVRRTLIPPNNPVFTDHVNFPAGATLLTLPWITSLLMTPLGSLFGPIVAWNLSIAFMLWAFGFSTAWLIQKMTDSWAAGILFGGLMTTQPMLMHAIGDGTPEHLSLWGMPFFLGALWTALSRGSTKWAIIAGLTAFMVAMDSPYHAIYSAIAGVAIAPWALLRRWSPTQRTEISWTISAFLTVSAIGALLVLLLYQGFSIKTNVDAEKLSLLKMNAVDLRSWWQHDFKDAFNREGSLAPTAIPTISFISALILLVIGAPKSLPWGFAGLFMLLLSMGLNPDLPVHLSQWMGGLGESMGEMILTFNSYLYNYPGIGEIRFPNRWLIPAALMFYVGGSYGLAKLYRLKILKRFAFWLSGILLFIGLIVNVKSSRIDLGFPLQSVPKIEFAEWIAEHPEEGAVLLIPQIRPPPKSGKRADLPVFADLGDSLSSSDAQFFQVIHGRKMYTKPNLKTLNKNDQDPNIFRLVRNWDDLAKPKLQGEDIPPSAYDSRMDGQRNLSIQALQEAGLKFIVADLGAYNDEAMEIIRTQLGMRIDDETTFDQGDGVIIFTLRNSE